MAMAESTLWAFLRIKQNATLESNFHQGSKIMRTEFRERGYTLENVLMMQWNAQGQLHDTHLYEQLRQDLCSI